MKRIAILSLVSEADLQWIQLSLLLFAATNPGNIWDYCQKGSGGRKQPENAPLPVVCISTTAGTGSEADNSGMVTNSLTKENSASAFKASFPSFQ